MTRLARRLYAPSVTTVALGFCTAMLGVLRDHMPMHHLGLLVTVAAIPTLGYALIHRATQATDDQLADMHTAGYRLALQHVHMGLLDSPAAPPDGGEGVEEEDTQGISIIRSEDLPDNVRPIRSRDDEEDDWKAV
ncbi:hypothetical protein ACFWJ5_21080 [Streptomyces qaidamensis]|uniref:hypothetical protein n=1 Tax=Streptomyces qaidamensis TaxID=1783515 RepID=UPI0036472CAB